MVIYGHIAIYSRIGLHMDYIFLLFDFFMLAVLEGNDIISEAHIAQEGTISSHVSLHTGQPDGMLEGAVGGCLSSQAGLQGDVLAGTVRNHISSHTGPPGRNYKDTRSHISPHTNPPTSGSTARVLARPAAR